MSTLVDTSDEIIANILRLHEFGSGSEKQRTFHADRIRQGKRFVAYLDQASAIFCPSKFAGYQDNGLSHEDQLRERHGTTTSNRITRLIGKPIEPGDRAYDKLDLQFLDYCASFGVNPTRWDRPRTYWIIRSDRTKVDKNDLTPARQYDEGASISVLSNRYERDRRARAACIEHHGSECAVCDLRFPDFYGGLGEGFIHVHHLKPLHQIAKIYAVDPVRDLRPVCPNCHAMLHWGHDEMLSVEQLRAKLSR